ncbi:PEP-CTERM sorting domain-containing protein [Myxococcota bacterium]|nr:PEP-CTERM sorting domain-containing protein [Myxococcota bacterium]
MNGSIQKFLLLLGLALTGMLYVPPVTAVSVGFESSEGYVVGPLSPPAGPTQAGWSGGAQAGFTNNDPGDEQVVGSEAYQGSNSWHYARGYGSPGQGTPFSPVMSDVAGPGTRMEFSIHFKAADASGDGSEQNLYLGTAAGNDRTGFNVYLENAAAGDGLHLYTYDWLGGASSKQVIATQLPRTDWHELEVVAVFDTDPLADVYEYSVNGNLVYTGNSWPNPWRLSMAFTPAYGNRIKFADGGGDTPAHDGFYYDDLEYDFTAIPEPRTAFLLLGALLGLAVVRRRSSLVAQQAGPRRF